MTELAGGLTLAAALAAYGFAWWSWRRGRPQAALLGVLAGGFLLRLFAAEDRFLHTWDERYHALVARNILAHPLEPTLYDTPLLPYDPQNWLEGHVWLHKPPLVLWMMAMSIAVFGATELAVRLPSLILSTLTIWATYRLGRNWRGETVALAAAFLASVNALLVQLAAGWTATDHPDTGLVAAVMFAITAAAVMPPNARGALVLGAVTGLAVLAKGLPGLVALPVGLAWHGVTGWARRVAIAVAACAAVAAPWALYTALAFPVESAWERAYELRHFLEPLEGHGGSAFFHVARMPRIFGEFVYLPLAVWLWRSLRGPREPQSVALALWIALPYLVFSIAASKMPAYVMIAAPAIFLVEAEACVWLAAQPLVGWKRVARTAAVVLVLAAPVRLAAEGLRLFRSRDRNPAWAVELRDLRDRLAGTRAVIFGCEHAIEAMFVTGQVAYAGVPERERLESLQREGWRVLVRDSPALPADRRGVAGVEYIGP